MKNENTSQGLRPLRRPLILLSHRKQVRNQSHEEFKLESLRGCFEVSPFFWLFVIFEGGMPIIVVFLLFLSTDFGFQIWRSGSQIVFSAWEVLQKSFGLNGMY